MNNYNKEKKHNKKTLQIQIYMYKQNTNYTSKKNFSLLLPKMVMTDLFVFSLACVILK
ncbi:hypothetical protein bcgnr5392_54660 [Bacillus cereus]